MTDLKQTEMTQNAEPISVFYDGGCPLCSREIGFLQRSFKDENVNWQNISPENSTTEPNENVTEGLTRAKAMKRFHVRNEQGKLLSGAPAFLVIWQLHPRFGWVAKALNRTPFKQILDGLYNIFLIARPLLQRIARKAASS